MSSSKFAVGVGRERKNNFQESNVFQARSNEKTTSRSNDGFFIKSSKHKKNSASDVTVNRKIKSIASPKGLSRKKETPAGPSQDTDESKSITQPFDKKAWRFKRYSKKYKLQQWKDQRKTHIMRGYDKTLNEVNSEKKYMDHAENTTEEETSSKKEPNLLNDSDSSSNNSEEKFTKPEQTLVSRRNKPFNKPNQVDKKTENLKRKAVKEQAIKEYKKKKLEKYKKLSRKTKRGQPVMKGRLEVLLEEIQNSIGH